MVHLKPTKILWLAIYSAIAVVAGVGYGLVLVNHGHPLPVAHSGSILTLPAIGVLLLLLAIPVFRYRRSLVSRARRADAPGAAVPLAAGATAPKRLDPFYAVRVLTLAKSVALAMSLFTGFNLGLVLLQLSTPAVFGSVFANLLASLGALFSAIIGVIVERACRIPDSGSAQESKEAVA